VLFAGSKIEVFGFSKKNIFFIFSRRVSLLIQRIEKEISDVVRHEKNVSRWLVEKKTVREG
jgi:hypothetical protein